MKNKENELLPCPFCGSSAYIGRETMSPYYTIGCITCRCVFVREFIDRDNAIKFWNKRK